MPDRHIKLHDVWRSDKNQAVWWVRRLLEPDGAEWVAIRAYAHAELGDRVGWTNVEPPRELTLAGTAPDFETAVAAAALGAYDD